MRRRASSSANTTSCCVRPGVLDVRASFALPVSALIALDLPAFERPANATSAPSSGGIWRNWCAAVENCARPSGFVTARDCAARAEAIAFGCFSPVAARSARRCLARGFSSLTLPVWYRIRGLARGLRRVPARPDCALVSMMELRDMRTLGLVGTLVLFAATNATAQQAAPAQPAADPSTTQPASAQTGASPPPSEVVEPTAQASSVDPAVAEPGDASAKPDAAPAVAAVVVDWSATKPGDAAA